MKLFKLITASFLIAAPFLFAGCRAVRDVIVDVFRLVPLVLVGGCLCLCFAFGCVVQGSRTIQGQIFGMSYSFTDTAHNDANGKPYYSADLTPAWLNKLTEPKEEPPPVVVEGEKGQ